MDEQKQKALGFAIAQIEKSHGKGSIMRLGDAPDRALNVIPTGALSLDMALGIGGIPKAELLKFLAPNPPEKRPWPFTPLPNAKNKVVCAPLLTPSMPLMPIMPKKLGFKLKASCYRSQTTANKPWKLRKPLFDPVLST